MTTFLFILWFVILQIIGARSILAAYDAFKAQEFSDTTMALT